MHGPSAYGGSLWLAATAAAEAMAGRLGDHEAAVGGPAGSSARRSPTTVGSGGVATTPTTTVAAPAQTASWPTSWPASGTPMRPGSATLLPADRVDDGAAHHPRLQCARVRRRSDGRGERHASGRIGRWLERAIGRGVGRHDLRAGRVHDRPRAWSTRAGRRPVVPPRSPTSVACGSGRPRRTTSAGTSGRRSTCDHWRSGRSRRRCGAEVQPQPASWTDSPRAKADVRSNAPPSVNSWTGSPQNQPRRRLGTSSSP